MGLKYFPRLGTLARSRLRALVRKRKRRFANKRKYNLSLAPLVYILEVIASLRNLGSGKSVYLEVDIVDCRSALLLLVRDGGDGEGPWILLSECEGRLVYYLFVVFVVCFVPSMDVQK